MLKIPAGRGRGTEEESSDMTSVKRDNPDSTRAKIQKSGSNASVGRQSRSVKRTPSKQYRKIIANEVASGDSYIFADENWRSDLHSPVRLISYKQHQGYINPAAPRKPPLERNPAIESKQAATSSGESNPRPKVRRTREESQSDACSSDYGVRYEGDEQEIVEVGYANINGASGFDLSRKLDKQTPTDSVQPRKQQIQNAAQDSETQNKGISFEIDDSFDISNEYSIPIRHDSGEIRRNLREGVMTSFTNGVDSDLTSHEDSDHANDVRKPMMVSTGGIQDLTDAHFYGEFESTFEITV